MNKVFVKRYENGKPVYLKLSNECEVWYKYDENGNYHTAKIFYDHETETWFDSNIDLDHFKSKHGLEKWSNYDGNNGKCLSIKYSDGYIEYLGEDGHYITSAEHFL